VARGVTGLSIIPSNVTADQPYVFKSVMESLNIPVWEEMEKDTFSLKV